MAIGKKRNGGANPLAGVAERQKDRRQAALALAQKAAQENMAANRQLETARASASASAPTAPMPSRLGERLAADAARQKERLDADAARQRERLDAQAAEAMKHRDWSAGQTALDRAWRAQEAALGRDWQSGEAKLTREQQIKLQQMQNAAALDRLREHAAQQRSTIRENNKSRERIEKGANRYRLALQRLKNEGAIGKENVKGAFAAGRDAAKYAHEREKWDYDASQKRADFEYEETFKARQKRADEEYKEQQKIREENRKYGIPDGVELSNEDRAKILAGTHEYIGNTQKEKDQIKAYEDVLAGQLSQDERDAIQLEYDLFREEHPANRVQEIPIERRAPKQTEINGQTYILNNGKWEPLKDDRELEMRRDDAKRSRADKLYAELLSRPIKTTGEDRLGRPKEITRMRTPEEAMEIMRRVYPDLYPQVEESSIDVGIDQNGLFQPTVNGRSPFEVSVANELSDPDRMASSMDSFIANAVNGGLDLEQTLGQFSDNLLRMGIPNGSEQYNALMAQFRERVAALSATGGGSSSQKFDITIPVNTPSEAKAKWKSRKD